MESIAIVFACLNLFSQLRNGFSVEAEATINQPILYPIDEAPDMEEWDVEQLVEFKFKSVDSSFKFVQDMQPRDSDEGPFVFDARSQSDNGSGGGGLDTTAPPTDDDLTQMLLSWRVLVIVVAIGLVVLACCICCPVIICQWKRRSKRGSFDLEQLKEDTDELMFSKRLSTTTKWYDEPSLSKQAEIDQKALKATSFGKEVIARPQEGQETGSTEKKTDEAEGGKEPIADSNCETKEEKGSEQHIPANQQKDASALGSHATKSSTTTVALITDVSTTTAVSLTTTETVTPGKKPGKNAEVKPVKSVTFKMAEGDDVKHQVSPEIIVTAEPFSPSTDKNSHNGNMTEMKTSSPGETGAIVVNDNTKDARDVTKKGDIAMSQPSQVTMDNSLDIASLEAELHKVMESIELEEEKEKEKQHAEAMASIEIDTDQTTWL